MHKNETLKHFQPLLYSNIDKLQFVGHIGGRIFNPPPNVAYKLQFTYYSLHYHPICSNPFFHRHRGKSLIIEAIPTSSLYRSNTFNKRGTIGSCERSTVVKP